MFQTLRSQFFGNKVHLDELIVCSKQLTKLLDTLVSQSVDRAVREATSGWQEVTRALDERLGVFESVRQRWQDYEAEFEVCKVWIEAKEAEVHAMVKRGDSSQHLEAAKVRQHNRVISRHALAILIKITLYLMFF